MPTSRITRGSTGLTLGNLQNMYEAAFGDITGVDQSNFKLQKRRATLNQIRKNMPFVHYNSLLLDQRQSVTVESLETGTVITIRAGSLRENGYTVRSGQINNMVRATHIKCMCCEIYRRWNEGEGHIHQVKNADHERAYICEGCAKSEFGSRTGLKIVLCKHCNEYDLENRIKEITVNKKTIIVCDSCLGAYALCAKCNSYKNQDKVRSVRFITKGNSEDWLQFCMPCIKTAYMSDEISDCDKCHSFFEKRMLSIINDKKNIYDGFELCQDCIRDSITMSRSRRERIITPTLKSTKAVEMPNKIYTGLEIEVEKRPARFSESNWIAVRLAVDEAHANLHNDGSLNNGLEILMPPLWGTVLAEETKKMLDVLDQNNLTVWDTCGLHVHLDATELSEEDVFKIFKLYVLIEKFLYYMVQYSRWNNHYCKRMAEEAFTRDIAAYKENRLDRFLYRSCRRDGESNFAHFKEIFGKKQVENKKLEEKKDKYVMAEMAREKESHRDGTGRYWSMNFHSYYYRQTLESRLHHGTLDYEEIKGWINTLHGIYLCGQSITEEELLQLNAMKEDKGRLAFFMDRILVTTELKNHYKKQVDKYHLDKRSFIKLLEGY